MAAARSLQHAHHTAQSACACAVSGEFELSHAPLLEERGEGGGSEGGGEGGIVGGSGDGGGAGAEGGGEGGGDEGGDGSGAGAETHCMKVRASSSLISMT